MPLNGVYSSLIVAVLGSVAILIWRVRESRRAVSTKTILIPPLGMATGFSMFVFAPQMRIPWTWGLGAFVAGAVLLAYPLLRTTRLTREGGNIMMQRHNAFIPVILGLAAIRLAARSYIGEIVSVPQTAALFFVLAFGMIARWRTWMFFEYRRLTQP
jgi:membrane protein CcdC involved in cytochrome C biogenesis